MMNDQPPTPHHPDVEQLARNLERRSDALKVLGFNAAEIARLIRSTIVRGPDVPGLGRDYSKDSVS